MNMIHSFNEYPLVSIIVPVFNVKAFLSECLDSLINQSYPNIEIILVDDGSTDGSGKICDDYGRIDSRVKIIHKENGGLSDARNAGIEIATGNYITFVDSDDLLLPNTIEYLINLILANNADISVCQRIEIDENNNVIQKFPIDRDVLLTGNYNCMYSFLSKKDIGTVAWGKIYRRNIFEDVKYPKGRFHEDVFTTYKTVAKSDKIAIGKECLYAYRIRKNSIMNQSFTMKHLDGIIGYEQMKRFLEVSYPNLARYAVDGIIYSSNMCVVRLAKTELIDSEVLDYLKSNYKKNLYLYLKGNSRILSKLFAIAARLNIDFLIKILKRHYTKQTQHI